MKKEREREEGEKKRMLPYAGGRGDSRKSEPKEREREKQSRETEEEERGTVKEEKSKKK